MNILVAALDWGLGHTTRIIPVIYKLRQEGNNVIIAATANQQMIYIEHFPDIKIIPLHSISPIMSRGKSQIFSILKFLPNFFFGTFKDRIAASKISVKYKIEQIISDNRYGFRTGKTNNILISHQLNLQLPKSIKAFHPLIQKLIKININQFDECRIPDFLPPGNLTGALSFPLPILRCKIKFIGPLSRFQFSVDLNKFGKIPEILFIVSGPEYQRTELENIFLKEISNTPEIPSYLIIRGLPGTLKSEIPNCINHTDTSTLKSLIANAKHIICRSGYSTIMDLNYMNRTALLIPTPGQTEQEYLAVYLQKEGRFLYETQKNFNLKSCLARLQNFNPLLVQQANGTISS